MLWALGPEYQCQELSMKNKIKVLDNFLPTNDHHKIYEIVINSLFRIGWSDTLEERHKAYPNLHSVYTFEDVQKLNILDSIFKLNIKDVSLNTYWKCMVNLTKPMDVNFVHLHPDQVGAVYYANETWNPEWGGETLFYEDNTKDIRFSSPYTPNRLIIFDGAIPHTIKAQNILGATYRFSITFLFRRKKNNESES